MSQAPLLQMRQVDKWFGGVHAVSHVDFEVRAGEIHALIGENGAGKSTLMRILSGAILPDGGEIVFDGRKLHMRGPNAGIAMIHQELNLVPELTVYENIFLGREHRTGRVVLNRRSMRRAAQRLMADLGLDIDTNRPISRLRVGQRQLVEIAKALSLNARIIIMDEPTTSLTQREIEKVFSIMRNLTREGGATILFISHKLGEVVEFCDAYTVLRNGEKVAEGRILQPDGSKISQTDIARMMVGRDVLGVKVYEEREIGEELLSVENLSVKGAVNDVSFTLRKGEVVGITGLLGDGKEQLVGCLFGDIPKQSGRVALSGRPVDIRHPAQGRRKGIGFLPSNRKENAIIKDFSVKHNITIVTLDELCRGTTISKKRERAAAEEARDRLSIKVQNIDNPITSLSGGNQQKAVLSKWLRARPKVMILSNPTQGVDVGAKNEIYAQIMELAKGGIGVIITSGEAQEISRICDRALVMYHGSLQGELSREELTEENIMILSTGGALT